MPWDFADNLPIYAQLVDRLKQRIVTGEYPPGGKLPSVRELATEAAVNPNTVQRAFSELESSGLIYTLRTSGKYVTDDESAIEDAKQQLAAAHIRAYRAAMRAMGYSDERAVTLLQNAIEKENEKEEEEGTDANSAM